MFKKAIAIAAAAAGIIALTGGTAFAYGSKSTKLSNGVLKVTADNGCTVSGNCSLYYAQTSYKKTGGDRAPIQLALSTGVALFKTDAMKISAGETKTKNWGGLAKSQTTDCSVAGYMIASTGKYYTPNLDDC